VYKWDGRRQLEFEGVANGIGDLLRLGRFPGARSVESSGNAIGEGAGDVAHDIELEDGVEDAVVSVREAAGDEPRGYLGAIAGLNSE
jgi:3-mercaptopyruvate sulfurtransferase SseA